MSRQAYSWFALALFFIGCSGAHHRARIPDFVWKAAKSQETQKIEMKIGPCGKLARVSATVAKANIPEWVLKLADDKIGKGEDKSFEVEVDDQGEEVYEVTRNINGLEVELSAKAKSQTFKYIERQVQWEVLPAPIRAEVEKMSGFQTKEAGMKEGPGIKEFEIEGRWNDAEYSLYFDEAGKLLGKYLLPKAEVKIAL